MSIAVAKSSERSERPTLAPDKGRELVGILLCAVGTLAAAALGSFHPNDPSVLHRSISDSSPIGNLVGPFGAHVAALAFGFLGLTCLLIPVFAIVAGVRRLRRQESVRVVGRGVGAGLLLVGVPGLAALTVGRMPWPLGGSIEAGGAVGHLLASLLTSKLETTGALVVLGSVCAVGATLAVQRTLGELLEAWRSRLATAWQEWMFARARRKERREKERARRRVVTKHLQRVVEEKQRAEERERAPEARVQRPRVVPSAPPFSPAERSAIERDSPAAEGPLVRTGGRVDLPLRPLRITERRGVVESSIRRVAGEPRESVRETPSTPEFRPPAPPVLEDFAFDLDADLDAAFGAPPAPRQVPPSSPSAVRAPTPMPTPLARRAATPTSPTAPTTASTSGAAAAPPQRALPFPVEPVVPGALPPVNLLQLDDQRAHVDETELVRLGEAIRSRCAEFGVEGTIEAISPGPVITVFELQPAPGVKVAHVVNLQDDLALALKAESVRIDRMAGRSTLGLEVPNQQRSTIRLGNLIADERFRRSPSVLTMALGTDIHGQPYYADLATMPHLLVAGATGAGKSVGLQSMITSILYKARRDEVQFIFIDPKRIELGVYADIPHLKTEVVVDMKKAANALRWAVAEMERRYRMLAEVHVRSIGSYNRAIADPEVRERLSLNEDGAGPAASMADVKPMPYYVVIIDELADLMMVSSSDVETSIARLAQMARAVGIHLIIATQRPSVDVLTGTIKANFPCRIAYATPSRHDSRTILDQVGAEKLLGKGDMLFMPPGSSRILRLHGAYISEQETAALVRWLKKQGKPDLDPDVLRDRESASGGGEGFDEDGDDDLFEEAARLIVRERQASASFLQRRMRVGFSRAGRLIDLMERDGLLGPSQGSKPREILVPPDYFEEVASTHFDDE